jgi:hypothetical protein
MRRGAEGKTLDEHLIARAYPAGQQGQMHGGCAGRERDDLFASAGELFQVFLESIDIRPQGNHPVRVESLLDKLLLLARHMRQAEIDTVFLHIYFCISANS